MYVAIDTSTETASLALVRDGLLLSEITWRTGQNHTVQLLPNLTHLFQLTGTNAKQLTAVIVGKGPGSFNGLRVGVSVAKGLSFSLGIPIVGINSLEVEAYQYAETGLPVCPVINAGRNEVATALFQKQGNDWRQRIAGQITTLENLVPQLPEKTIFCGEYIQKIASKLVELFMEKAVIVSPVTNLRRAGYLAELGMKRLSSGDTDNAATLQPIYLRRPPITEAKKL